MAATSRRADDPRVEKAEATASLLPGLRNHMSITCAVCQWAHGPALITVWKETTQGCENQKSGDDWEPFWSMAAAALIQFKIRIPQLRVHVGCKSQVQPRLWAVKMFSVH